MPALLAALERAGVTVAAATVARPSLDDVYLRYAGRRYADAEAAGARTAGDEADAGTAPRTGPGTAPGTGPGTDSVSLTGGAR